MSGSLSLATLIPLCRALHYGVSAGLSLTAIWRQQSQSGPTSARLVAGQLADALEAGSTLEDALKSVQGAFPPLFHALVSVGERTGRLPEVFRELEDFFSLQQTLWRQFLTQIAWPVFQFVAGTVVIALLLLILGLIADHTQTRALDPLGLGLSGASGAVLFLVGVYGTLALLAVGYWFLTRQLGQAETVARWALRVPVLGGALEALALQRLCVGLRLTLEAGLSVAQATKRSLRATDNPAFVALIEPIAANLKGGGELAPAFSRSGYPFPPDFVQVLTLGETTGRVPELMGQQATYWQEEASRRLKRVAAAAGVLVWLSVVVLMIFAILSVAMIYFNALNEAMKM
jgi:type IV pilus assembly protein PilC